MDGLFRIANSASKQQKIFSEMYSKMCIEKSKIDRKNITKYWDKAKRATNPYEYINILGTNILLEENKDIYKK